MKILLTGDIHIGRRSSRIPESLNGPQFSCAQAWRRIVNLALEEAVDLVAVSGDLIDQDNRYFEAYGPLEWGLARLGEAGIETYAVAGNHDFDVLRQFASSPAFKGFHLLGAGGTWEKAVHTREGREVLHVIGWSFPREKFAGNPFDGFDITLDGEVPVLGLLHTDLDQPGSHYAPSSLSDLRRRDAALWLIGHVHKPELIRLGHGRAVLNPGSPQAMDPGETGPHGAWLAEISAGGVTDPRPVDLSTVRYDIVEVDTNGLDDPEALKTLAIKSLSDHLSEVESGAGPLEVLSCRMRFVGRTRLHRRLEELLGAVSDDLEMRPNRVTAVVEKVLIETRPPFDLSSLLKASDTSALLARLLLDLEGEDLSPPETHLLQQVREKMETIHRAGPYAGLSDVIPDVDEARGVLLRQGLLLLDALLAQKDES